jgi:MYXO-CTERM domain-containing protein
MKTSLALASSFALLLVSGISNAASVQYKASLDGKQETPANPSTATGSATLVHDTTTNKLTGTVTLTGITATSAQHIHNAACGVSGAPTTNGTLPAPAANVIAVNVTLTAAEATALAAGDLYVNVHTAAYGGGEIRGQIYPNASATVCLGPNDGGTPDAADAGKEAGTDAGSSGSSGTSGTSGTSGSSGSSGSNGAVTTPADGGNTAAPSSGDSGGCSTAPSDDSSNGLAMLGLAAFGAALVVRARKKK